ncbi:hypothetical protein IWQ49_006544 [Labrenzia sp. EL_126]|nr:hypothetical protein [Labrenzia sp. EL_126]
MMTNMNVNDFETVKADLIGKAWSDEAFRAELMANPKEVLSAYGAEIPPGIDVEVVEDASDRWHFVVPAAPEEGEISDSDLIGANGGTTKICSIASLISLISDITTRG